MKDIIALIILCVFVLFIIFKLAYDQWTYNTGRENWFDKFIDKSS